LLEIKKSECYREIDVQFHSNLSAVVYLFLVSYGRSKPDGIHLVIPNFLQVNPFCYAAIGYL
jgi:hypothetical protein